jgi:hypothetical protein
MYTTAIVVAAILLLLAALAFFGHRRSAKTAIVYFRCEGCKQRLRYQAGKAGRGSICPRCYRRATLPQPKNQTGSLITAD